MIKNKIDWLTLTCLTSKEISHFDLLEYALKTLDLNDLWSNFTYVGRDKYYAEVYRYNDISILLCRNTPKQLIRQGICIKFSGNGLAFYHEHLQDHKTDLRTVCRKWRAISVNGYFTRCSRFDFAVDDICKNNQNPYLTMKRVHNSINKGEVRSLLSIERSPKNSKLDICEDTSKRYSESVGDTIYFGKRNGGQVIIRFYDKLLEQKAKKKPIDEDVSSWVRCELELHNARAMAAFNAFCDMSADDFSEYMSKVLNNYLTFIYLDDSNRSRCTIKRWWSVFLGTTASASLVKSPYQAATFSATQLWLQRSVFPTLAYYIKCIGLTRFLKKLSEYMHKKPSTRIQQMVNDFETVKNGGLKELFSFGFDSYLNYATARGLDPWLLTGAVSATELKKDFADLCECSDSALYLEGEQLSFEDCPGDFLLADVDPYTL